MAGEQYIDGIHNYCDRWCERCSENLRCRVFRETERDRRRHVQRGEDPDSVESTMRDVGRNLTKAHRLLERFARREGINLDELARQSTGDRTRLRPQPDEEPLVREADKFMTGCHELLDQLRQAFDESADDVNRRGGFMDVAGEAEELARIRESYDVLCWDHTLVAVKIRRALSARQRAVEEAGDPVLKEMDLFDGAGSAAVVRRSLLRSQAALQVLYDWDESLRDGIIELLATAERLLRGLESCFPDSKTFKWPPVFPGDDKVH